MALHAWLTVPVVMLEAVFAKVDTRVVLGAKVAISIRAISGIEGITDTISGSGLDPKAICALFCL